MVDSTVRLMHLNKLQVLLFYLFRLSSLCETSATAACFLIRDAFQSEGILNLNNVPDPTAVSLFTIFPF